MDRLKRLAAIHHRSLQGELQAILDNVSRMAQPAESLTPLRLVTVDGGGTSTWNREDIYGSDGR